MIRLNIFRKNPLIKLPSFATTQAACFDIAFQCANVSEYKGYNSNNAPFTRPISNRSIKIMPGDRIAIPTGLIFDIPEGYSVRIHPRSGLSYKNGLVLANLEAVIDSDYTDETLILIHNVSTVDQTITDGDRIAQGELIKKEEYTLWETMSQPGQKGNRIGGLGSTGISLVNNGNIVYKTTNVEPEKKKRGRPKKIS